MSSQGSIRAQEGGGLEPGRPSGRRSGPPAGRRPCGISEGGRLMKAPRGGGRAAHGPSVRPWYGPEPPTGIRGARTCVDPPQTADSVRPVEGRAVGPPGSHEAPHIGWGIPDAAVAFLLSLLAASIAEAPFITHGKLPQSSQVPASLVALTVQTATAVVYLSFAAPARRGEPRGRLRAAALAEGQRLVPRRAGARVRGRDRPHPDRRRREPEPGRPVVAERRPRLPVSPRLPGGAFHRRRARRRPARRGAPLPWGAAAGPHAADQPDDRRRRLGARVRARPRRPRPGRRVRRPRPLPPRPRLG